MDRPDDRDGGDVRPDRDEDETKVRRRAPIVERSVLGWVAFVALVVGGSVGAMQALSDPMVYEVTERAKRDEAALRELVADRGPPEPEPPEFLVAENHVAYADAEASADPRGPATDLGSDPMAAAGALGVLGDRLGTSFGHGGLGLSGTGRGGGLGLSGSGHGGGGTFGSLGTIGSGSSLSANAVLQNNFIAGTGVRARLEDLLDRGMEVDGERVRLTAFTDRHSLPYAVPTDRAVALYAELERPRVVTSGDEVHLAISLVARRGERPRRPRMDVRLVLDVSGSMAGEKLAHALAAARRLVERLRPTDRLGIITYESEARMVMEPQAVGGGLRAERALAGLEAGGGTNIEAGLRLVRAHPPERPRASDVGLVVLVSDGEATDGITTPRELGAIARSLYDEHGVLTTTIGLGTSFDESTMLTIAREGSGSYHFVRRPADVGDVLTDELDERVQAVAQALRLRVELAPGVVATKVYGSRALDEGERAAVRGTELATDARIAEELGVALDREHEEGGIRMHLPTFRRGDDHVVLFELRVPPGTVGAGVDVANVYLDYKDLIREDNGHEESFVTATRVADRRAALASTRREVKRTVLAFSAAEALSEASNRLDGGDREGALRVLDERRDVLLAGASLWDDRQLRRDADLLGRYARVVEGVWDRFGTQDRRTLLMAMGTFAERRMR